MICQWYYPPLKTKLTMENPPFEGVCPIEHGDFPKGCFFAHPLFWIGAFLLPSCDSPTGSIESRDSFCTSRFQRWHWRASAIPLVPKEWIRCYNWSWEIINSWDASISWEIPQYSTERYRKISERFKMVPFFCCVTRSGWLQIIRCIYIYVCIYIYIFSEIYI